MSKILSDNLGEDSEFCQFKGDVHVREQGGAKGQNDGSHCEKPRVPARSV